MWMIMQHGFSKWLKVVNGGYGVVLSPSSVTLQETLTQLAHQCQGRHTPISITQHLITVVLIRPQVRTLPVRPLIYLCYAPFFTAAKGSRTTTKPVSFRDYTPRSHKPCHATPTHASTYFTSLKTQQPHRIIRAMISPPTPRHHAYQPYKLFPQAFPTVPRCTGEPWHPCKFTWGSCSRTMS